jgi:hypothetical protein
MGKIKAKGNKYAGKRETRKRDKEGEERNNYTNKE